MTKKMPGGMKKTSGGTRKTPVGTPNAIGAKPAQLTRKSGKGKGRRGS